MKHLKSDLFKSPDISWKSLDFSWVELLFCVNSTTYLTGWKKTWKLGVLTIEMACNLERSLSRWLLSLGFMEVFHAWPCFLLPLSFHLRRTDHLNNYWEPVLSCTSLTTWERCKKCNPSCEENYLTNKSNRHVKSIGIPPNNNHRMW